MVCNIVFPHEERINFSLCNPPAPNLEFDPTSRLIYDHEPLLVSPPSAAENLQSN